jgi:uncharacterized membrane protein YphA (DoxX/SURF4 family)
MRLVVAGALMYIAGSTLLSGPPIPTAIVSVPLVGGGILLAAGLCTPIVGMLVALIETLRLLTLPSDWLLHILLATFGAALAMLGPGQWSVDARLFGWKRIEPSPRKR